MCQCPVDQFIKNFPPFLQILFYTNTYFLPLRRVLYLSSCCSRPISLCKSYPAQCSSSASLTQTTRGDWYMRLMLHARDRKKKCHKYCSVHTRVYSTNSGEPVGWLIGQGRVPKKKMEIFEFRVPLGFFIFLDALASLDFKLSVSQSPFSDFQIINDNL